MVFAVVGNVYASVDVDVLDVFGEMLDGMWDGTWDAVPGSRGDVVLADLVEEHGVNGTSEDKAYGAVPDGSHGEVLGKGDAAASSQ